MGTRVVLVCKQSISSSQHHYELTCIIFIFYSAVSQESLRNVMKGGYIDANKLVPDINTSVKHH